MKKIIRTCTALFLLLSNTGVVTAQDKPLKASVDWCDERKMAMISAHQMNHPAKYEEKSLLKAKTKTQRQQETSPENDFLHLCH